MIAAFPPRVQPCEIQMSLPLEGKQSACQASARDDAQSFCTMASTQQRGELALCLACSGRISAERLPARPAACLSRSLHRASPYCAQSSCKSGSVSTWSVTRSCSSRALLASLVSTCAPHAAVAGPALAGLPCSASRGASLSIALAADRAHFASPCVRL